MAYEKQELTFEDWLVAKQKTIGGSEASAVIGRSKWLTPNDLFNKLVYGKAKKVVQNERMTEGTIAESHIRDMFALEHRNIYKVINPPTDKQWFFFRTDKPYLSYTPDGLMVDMRDSKKWILEIKDVELRKTEDRNAWEGNLLPDQYFCQCLQGLIVLDDYVGAILVARLKYYRFEDDEMVLDHIEERYFTICKEDEDTLSQINYLENKETSFYENQIKARKRPKTKFSMRSI